MNYNLVIRGPAHNWTHVKETKITPQELDDIYIKANVFGEHPNITLRMLLKAAQGMVKTDSLCWCRSWLDNPSSSEELEHHIAIKKLLVVVGINNISDEHVEWFLEGFSDYFPNCYNVGSIDYITYEEVIL